MVTCALGVRHDIRAPRLSVVIGRVTIHYSVTCNVSDLCIAGEPRPTASDTRPRTTARTRRRDFNLAYRPSEKKRGVAKQCLVVHVVNFSRK